MSDQAQCIHSLSTSTIKKLVRYLYLPANYSIAHPPGHWLVEQEEMMRDLPGDCLRPPVDRLNVMNFIKRGLMKMSEKQPLSFMPEAAVLCPSHRGLNPWMIRSLFALVTREATEQCERIRRDRGDKGPELIPSIQAFVQRMNAVQALWLDPHTFELVYGHLPDLLEKVASQCEACILSAIGSRPLFLGDLRAHLLARTEGRQPVLLRVVEAWIACFPGDANTIYKDSAVLAQELQSLRTEIAKARWRRREPRRQLKKTSPLGSLRNASNTTSAQGYRPSVSGRQSVSTQRTGVDGDAGASGTTNPFDDHYDVTVDDNDENKPWQDLVGDFYERLAAQNGNGHAFDRTSVHPSFANPIPQDLTMQLNQQLEMGREVTRDQQESIWQDASVYSAGQYTHVLSGQQPAIPASSTGGVPATSLSGAEKRTYDAPVSQSSLSPVALTSTPNFTPSKTQIQHAVNAYFQTVAASSVYSNNEPARPHPPRSNVPIASSAPSQPKPSGPTNTGPSRRRPSAVVSTPSSQPHNNRPVTQDPATGLPPYAAASSLSQQNSNYDFTEEARVKRAIAIEKMTREGRPSASEYVPPLSRPRPFTYRPRPDPSVMYPALAYNATDATGAEPAATSSTSQTGPSASRSRWAPEDSRSRVPSDQTSEVSTIWPHDSITSVGIQR